MQFRKCNIGVYSLSNETPVKGVKVLMLCITFKENCPDIPNTKAIDIYHELCEYEIDVDFYDPCLPRIFGGPILSK